MIKYIYNQMFYLQECGDFTWRVSDCEELVGGFTGDGEVGLVQKKQSKRVQIVCSRTTHARGNLLGVHIGVYKRYYCL